MPAVEASHLRLAAQLARGEPSRRHSTLSVEPLRRRACYGMSRFPAGHRPARFWALRCPARRDAAAAVHERQAPAPGGRPHHLL